MIEDHHKIQMLLQEYAGLRTEIVHRTNNMYQLISVGALIFGLCLSLTGAYRIGMAVVVGALAIAYFSWVIAGDIQKAAARLREIERDLNTRAGGDLLVWENHFGSAVTGWWRWWGRRPKPTASTDQPSN